MGVSVPTGGDAIDGAKMTAINGGSLGLAEVAGRSILGPGIGTAAGGIAVAAAQTDNQTRDVMATVAGERAVNEMLGGM